MVLTEVCGFRLDPHISTHMQMGWDGLLAGGMRKLSHMMGMVQNFIANIGFQCGKPNKKTTMTGDGLYHHLW